MSIAHAELSSAYNQVRTELIRVLQRHQLDPRSGTAIAQRLGLNRQLAWQVATIAGEANTADGLTVLPGNRGLELFVEASRKRGEEMIDAQREALSQDLTALLASIERLEGVIRMHAGDRATLSLIAAAWDSSEVERRTEDLRRDGHRAQCALLGAKVETQVRGIIFAPSQHGDPSRVAMASYQGLSNITRIRAGHRSRILYAELPTHDDGTRDLGVQDISTFIREKFQLETSLSSVGPEEIEYLVDAGGAACRGWVALRPGDLGVQASMHLAFTGLPAYENPRYVTAKDRLNQIAIVCHIPTETLLIDCLMDKRLAESEEFVQSLSLQCFDASTGHPMKPANQLDPAFLFDLTQHEPLRMGAGWADVSYAQTGDLVARAAYRLGSKLEDLVGIRYRVKYMLAPMSVVITRRLPSQ
jgi:hypothetical protein